MEPNETAAASGMHMPVNATPEAASALSPDRSAVPDARTGTPPRSVAELYEDHILAATRLAFLLTGDRAAAEDIAQEAFLRAAARLFAMRDPDRFGAYLGRTVVREVAASNRARSRESGREVRVHRSDERTAAVDVPASAVDFVRVPAIVARTTAGRVGAAVRAGSFRAADGRRDEVPDGNGEVHGVTSTGEPATAARGR